MERFIQDIAKKAGEAVVKKFGKIGIHYLKSEHRGDAVTTADLLADKMITTAIRKKYSTHGIISEESARHQSEAEYTWIIDPIDGTLNFATGIPLFGVMVALAHRDEVILSAIYLPTTKEMFFAKKGKGAYLNGKRIFCSKHPTWSTSTGVGPSGMRPRAIRLLPKLIKEMQGKHMVYTVYGSVAIDAAYIACGRRDWYFGLNGQIHDYAPIVLLMRESGCKVTKADGTPWKLGDTEAVAANPVLHRQLLKLTKGV